MTPACNLNEDELPVAAVGFDGGTGVRCNAGFDKVTGVRCDVGLGAGVAVAGFASATDSRGDPNGEAGDRLGLGLTSFC